MDTKAHTSFLIKFFFIFVQIQCFQELLNLNSRKYPLLASTFIRHMVTNWSYCAAAVTAVHGEWSSSPSCPKWERHVGQRQIRGTLNCLANDSAWWRAYEVLYCEYLHQAALAWRILRRTSLVDVTWRSDWPRRISVRAYHERSVEVWVFALSCYKSTPVKHGLSAIPFLHWT